MIDDSSHPRGFRRRSQTPAAPVPTLAPRGRASSPRLGGARRSCPSRRGVGGRPYRKPPDPRARASGTASVSVVVTAAGVPGGRFSGPAQTPTPDGQPARTVTREGSQHRGLGARRGSTGAPDGVQEGKIVGRGATPRQNRVDTSPYQRELARPGPAQSDHPPAPQPRSTYPATANSREVGLDTDQQQGRPPPGPPTSHTVRGHREVRPGRWSNNSRHQHRE